MRRILAATLTVALWTPAVAAAQQSVPVTGNFGGGAVTTPPASPFAAGGMERFLVIRQSNRLACNRV